MPMMTATLVLLLGVVPTYGSAASWNGAREDWKPQRSDSDSSATLSLKECDGQTTTAGSVTARLHCRDGIGPECVGCKGAQGAGCESRNQEMTPNRFGLVS